MTRRQAVAVIVLFAISCMLGAFSLYWAGQQAASTGHKFCQIIQLATAHPVPKPADPAANPSREQNYIGYVAAVDLGHRLGCPRH